LNGATSVSPSGRLPISFIAIKRGYSKDVLTYRGLTVAVIIGIIIGFVIGRLV
jgi:hypothetical protein